VTGQRQHWALSLPAPELSPAQLDTLQLQAGNGANGGARNGAGSHGSMNGKAGQATPTLAGRRPALQARRGATNGGPRPRRR
jgi:hypothetical protein